MSISQYCLSNDSFAGSTVPNTYPSTVTNTYPMPTSHDPLPEKNVNVYIKKDIFFKQQTAFRVKRNINIHHCIHTQILIFCK